MSDDYETHELELAFQAGAASRDAEVAKLESDRLQQIDAKTNFMRQLNTVEEERDQLRAQINKLRAAMQTFVDRVERGEVRSRATHAQFRELLATTTEQSLAECRNKVIEAFVNEFSRHVGGDGEFWLHELQDFAMKEQP